MYYGRLVLAACAVGIAVLGFGYWYYNDTEPNVRVVNVLTEDMYRDAHIAGSIHVDMDQLKQKMQEWNKQTPVVFYCSNYLCQASIEAARMFRDNGFQHAYAYEGGMAEWYQLSQNNPEYEFVGPAQMVPEYTIAPEDIPQQKASEIAISAEELQKLMKTGILPNRS